MDNNLYWSVYKSIEGELIDLSEKIHIDDKQLDVYSMKIAELLIRCVVEIESIVKELYFKTGGVVPAQEKDLYFDTDCIKHLEEKWSLSKKQVLVVSPSFYFKREENKVLTPFHKAFKRGSSSSDWQKAYQAVKHNRGKNLTKGNLKHLIRAMAALYLANIYFQDHEYHLGEDSSGNNFNRSLGSSIFAVKAHVNTTISISKLLPKNDDYDNCVYIVKPTDKTRTDATKLIRKVNSEIAEDMKSNLVEKLVNKLNEESITPDTFSENLNSAIQKIKQDSIVDISRNHSTEYKKVFTALRYEAILNKHQFDEAVILLDYKPSS